MRTHKDQSSSYEFSNSISDEIYVGSLCVFVCVYMCLSVCVSVCLYMYVSVCVLVCVCLYMSMYMHK